MAYPFPQFGHGPISVDSDTKCAETFVVFARDTTARERAWIEDSCPECVRSFTWGERFAYFGSGGDTWDFDTVTEFCPDEAAALQAAEDWNGFSELMPVAMAKFVVAFDAWLERVHAKVPIAFANAPGPTEPDAWSDWSETQCDEALAALRAARAAHPWLARKGQGGSEPSAADKLAPRPRAAECFGWIERAVGRIAAHAPVAPAKAGARLDAVAAQLDSLAIDAPLARLSITEHHIHSLGEALANVLAALDAKRRKAAIGKLSPRAQLVYFASYAAAKHGDVAAIAKDPAAALDALAAKLPADDQWRAGSLLAFIAANRAHVTPAYSKPDRAGAKSALALFTRAIERGARGGEELDAAMRCARAAGNKRALVAIGTRAIDATRDPSVAKAAAAHARGLADAKASKRFGERAKAILAASTLAQDPRKDAAALAAHLADGGEPTPDLLGNLAFRLFGADADRKLVDKLVATTAEALLAEPTFGMNAHLVLNFTIMAGNHGHGARAIAVVEQLLARGLPLGDQLGLSLSYAATRVAAKALKRRVLALLTAQGASELSPLTLQNIAELHLQLGDKPAAIAALAQARDHGHPTFAALRDDKDFAPLGKDKAFVALFAKPAKPTRPPKPARRNPMG